MKLDTTNYSKEIVIADGSTVTTPNTIEELDAICMHQCSVGEEVCEGCTLRKLADEYYEGGNQ